MIHHHPPHGVSKRISLAKLSSFHPLLSCSHSLRKYVHPRYQEKSQIFFLSLFWSLLLPLDAVAIQDAVIYEYCGNCIAGDNVPLWTDKEVLPCV